MMRKVYGASQELPCPFCGGRATATNGQGLPVCHRHTRDEMNLRCVCGEWLDVKDSKFGPFFVCMRCGPVSYRRGLEANDLPLKRFDEL